MVGIVRVFERHCRAWANRFNPYLSCSVVSGTPDKYHFSNLKEQSESFSGLHSRSQLHMFRVGRQLLYR
jgi:hypothetical protein